jgi:hypothetical protein
MRWENKFVLRRSANMWRIKSHANLFFFAFPICFALLITRALIHYFAGYLSSALTTTITNNSSSNSEN